MNHRTRAVRRLAAAVTLAAVAGGLALPLVAAPAGATQATETRRVQGGDRYSTAAAIAADAFPDGATSVVVATGEKFADALAANGLAGALGAPVLLTESGRVPASTASALADLGAETIYLMGGTSAVSQAVEDDLAADYTVERVQGGDRFATAAAAGAAIAETDDGNPLTDDDGVGSTGDGVTAVLAFGLDFPDAVSGGAIAYAGRLPVLLTGTDEVPEATLDALESLGVEHILVVGGTTVIAPSVEAELKAAGYTTERLAGNDRWATNAAVNEYAEAEPALAFAGPTAYLSTGSKFADALSGGPAAGANRAPLVLTASTSLPTPTRDYLTANANAIDEIVALGGTSAIADAVVSAAATAARVDDVQALDVAPTTDEVLQQSSSAVNSDGARTYTVTGLEPGAEYVIALLDAESVRNSGSGDATFSSYSVSDEASTSIESVNGSQVGAAGSPGETVQEVAEARADGTITFVVDATAFDEIVPVVYEDADGDGALTLTGGESEELFGLGGKTTWVPAEAASNTAGGSYQDITAKTVRAEDGFFIANVVVDDLGTRADRTFFLESSDRYVDGTKTPSLTLTPSVFRSRLTASDVLDVEYQQDLQSRFTLVTDNGLQTFGLEFGTTVSLNAGLQELNGGDVWLLHFSGDVQVAPDASVTVSGGGTSMTLRNGTDTSSWSVSGDIITITVGRGVDAATVFYPVQITGLTGVRSVADGVDLPVSQLKDRIVDDGPALMPATSTCQATNTSCTIEFNEPMSRTSAQDPRNYSTQRGNVAGPPVVSAALGSDGRTVTLGFGMPLDAGDEIRPVDADSAVTDDDGKPSTQPFIVFVR
jgi:putative cell wall-binding protein